MNREHFSADKNASYAEQRWRGLESMVKSPRPNVALEAGLEALGLLDARKNKKLRIRIAEKIFKVVLPRIALLSGWTFNQIEESIQHGRDLQDIYAQGNPKRENL